MSARSATQTGSVFKRVLMRPGGGIIVLLIAISVIMAFLSPNFLTVSNWANLLNQAVFLVILAIGMTIVLVSRGIDLSVGAVLGLSGGVAANLMSNDIPMPIAFAAALATGVCLGIINGLVITKLKVPDFVATLAMLGVARGILFVWTGAVPFRSYMDSAYYFIAGLTPFLGHVTAPIVVALVVALASAAFMRRTPFGRHVYGIGSNPDAARLSGINVDRVKIRVYAVSGLLAAVAGILLAGRLTTVHPEMGVGMELDAIAAAVMGGAALTGGRGTVFGAVAGALTLTLIQNAINILNVNPYWETIVVGAVILLAVIAERVGSAVLKRPERQAPASA
jgi:ribose transport system permease protein